MFSLQFGSQTFAQCGCSGEPGAPTAEPGQDLEILA